MAARTIRQVWVMCRILRAITVGFDCVNLFIAMVIVQAVAVLTNIGQ
jgi:hypothetical protein